MAWGTSVSITACSPDSAGPPLAREVQVTVEASIRLDHLGLTTLEYVGMQRLKQEIPPEISWVGIFGAVYSLQLLETCWDRYRLGTEGKVRSLGKKIFILNTHLKFLGSWSWQLEEETLKTR